MGDDAGTIDLSDLSGGYAGAIPRRSELQARIRDFLLRKDLPFAAGVEALQRLLGSGVPMEKVKSTLRGLLARLHRERAAAADVSDPAADEWLCLAERIQSAGRYGTIEDYAPYIITVDFTGDLSL
jgi:hypothetical protein